MCAVMRATVNLTRTKNAVQSISAFQAEMPVTAKRQSVQASAAADSDTYGKGRDFRRSAGVFPAFGFALFSDST